ncbi:MAG: hypothetical protein QOF60_599 [Actinomycetota bacterium]|jgi:DNA/RNA-binding domain of Phe-tRNA-synthetase-like protein|nr:hypothetical protein [Actinomycetota bacterium]
MADNNNDNNNDTKINDVATIGRVTVSIGASVIERFPDVIVAGFAADLSTFDTDAGTDRAVPADLTIENLTRHPNIEAWRAAIAACGLKPSAFKGSAEQLIRRTLRSGPVTTGLPIVDAYCAVSTQYVAPLGAYDIERLPEPHVELRHARGTDTFKPLGNDTMPLGPDVVVYASSNTVTCFAWNCRDSKDTCLTNTSRIGLFLGEAVTARQRIALLDALDDLHAAFANAGAVTTIDGTTTMTIHIPWTSAASS